MRALAGFTLLLTALVFIAFEFREAADDRVGSVGFVTRYLESSQPAEIARTQIKKPTRARNFSPRSSLFSSAVSDIVNAEASASAPSKALDAIAAVTVRGWSTFVTFDRTARTDLRSLTPVDETATWELARDLQQELKRVGCYDGPIDGNWRRNSKAAMAVFVERVNAALPSEQPDYALLALVRGHLTRVCGEACSPGETIWRKGRCLPETIMAQADPSKAEATREVARRRPAAPLPGRIMGAGGPLKASDLARDDETRLNETPHPTGDHKAVTAYATPTNAIVALATAEDFAGNAPQGNPSLTSDIEEIRPAARASAKSAKRGPSQASYNAPRTRRYAHSNRGSAQRSARARPRARSYARSSYRRYVSVNDMIMARLRQ